MSNYFVKETEEVLKYWDGCVWTKTVKGDLGCRELTKALPCGEGFIPAGFRWDGASVGMFEYLYFLSFPKWKHPIASCRHDWRCAKAKTKEERKIADKLFKEDVAIGGTKWEQIKGYAGVRVGAWLGIGGK